MTRALKNVPLKVRFPSGAHQFKIISQLHLHLQPPINANVKSKEEKGETPFSHGMSVDVTQFDVTQFVNFRSFYICALTYGHHFGVVTERMIPKMQATEMSFL